MKWDVVVVGSGISSLTCAALLAKKGKSVCVLERYVKPGGYLHCFKRFGTQFDTGAHYVGALDKGQPFHTLLSYLDVYDPELFVPLDPDGFDELRFPSFEARFRRGYEATVAALSEQFPNESLGIATYFARIRQTAQLFPTYEYSEAYDETRLIPALETPLASVVSELIRDPKLQCVLYSYCWLHGVMPQDISFGFHSLVTDSLIRGAYGFRHGGDALTERFVSIIEKHGGKVLSRCGVQRLEVRDQIVREIITENGERVEAEWVVSGIHPKATFRLVENAEQLFSPAFRGRLSGIDESGGVFGVYASLRGESLVRPDRNYYYFAHESPSEFFKTSTPGGVPPMVFLARPDRKGDSGSSQRSERYPLLFHSPTPMAWFEPWRNSSYGKRSDDYESFKEAQADAIIGFVSRQMVGLKSQIERYVTSSPITNLHFNGSEEGSAYGIYHSIRNSGVRALGPRTHVRNLLLTGQSCLFPGLVGAATSGLRTAGALIGIKGLLRELSQISGRNKESA